MRIKFILIELKGVAIEKKILLCMKDQYRLPYLYVKAQENKTIFNESLYYFFFFLKSHHKKKSTRSIDEENCQYIFFLLSFHLYRLDSDNKIKFKMYV